MTAPKLAALAGALFLTMLVPFQAQAVGLFRAYLASDGSDANPCTLPQPCRLLPAALAAVDDGGEIWLLDSANFNTAQVTVSKSVTILAIPGAVGSVVATGGASGLRIDGASVVVSLRNLVLVGLGSSVHGVHFFNGAALHVADCEISGMGNRGIRVDAAGSNTTVRNTVLRDNFVGISATLANVTLDGLLLKGLTYAVNGEEGSTISITRSVVSGNTYGAYVTSNTTPSRIAIEHSALTGNSYGLLVATTSPAGVLHATVRGSTLSQNTTAGVSVTSAISATTHTVLSDNVITDNAKGVEFGVNTPIVYTRQNNVFKFNGSDVFNGTLTVLAAQ